jgi:nucleotide-binding universal stress UspA family protein
MALINRIMLPTAFAEPSHRAAEYVRILARQLDAEILVVHVVEPAQPIVVSDHGMVATTVDLPSQQPLEEHARRHVEEFAAMEFADFKDCVSTDVVTAIDRVAALADYAANHAVGLIVMGTHPSGFFRRLLGGTTGEALRESAPCPGLLVAVREMSSL